MLSLDKSKNDTSTMLDLLRATAAQMVCIGHAMPFFGIGWWIRPPHVPYMQNVGVLLFFIMSGFLITATLTQNSARPGYGFGRYFIDRFARIYSGLLPALAFVIVVDWVTLHLTSQSPFASNYNFGTLIANLGMLEGYRGAFQNSLQWPAFGSAAPLWTLAIEWHIYLFVGAVFFMAARLSPLWLLLIPVAIFFGQTPLNLLFGAFLPDGVGSGLFSLWLAGGTLSLLFSRYAPPLWISVLVLVGSIVAYSLMVSPQHEYEMRTYPALVLIVGSLIAITQRTKVIGTGSAKAIRVAADYSFTLYLTHYTVKTAFVSIVPSAKGWGWFFVLIGISNLAAYLIARPFEMKHRRFADWLRSLSLLGDATPATADRGMKR